MLLISYFHYLNNFQNVNSVYLKLCSCKLDIRWFNFGDVIIASQHTAFEHPYWSNKIYTRPRKT